MLSVSSHARAVARRATALAAAIVVALGLSATPASAQTSSEIHAGLNHAATTPGGNPTNAYDAFYDAPVPKEQLDRPGKILRTQHAPHLLNILGPNFPGYGKRILYTSTTVDGKIVPVSGAVIEPANPWRGKGPTPTVVFGPGTRGAGDACAPSRGPWMLGQLDPKLPTLGTNYELPNYQVASLLGMRVVVTDYIGLGTPGAHTYVLHDEEGHAMLDAARAVVPKGHPIGFWGYSQGGGASAAAAELAGSYAPELNVKATFSGAPPADLVASMRGVDNSTIQAVLGYALYGWAARYPEIGPIVERNISPTGRAFLTSTQNSCIADDLVRWGLRDTRTLTNNGKSISDAVISDPAVVKILNSQKLGRRTPKGPIMVSTPGNDDLVPSAQVTQMARDHCAAGGTVTMRNDALPALTPGVKLGANHAIGIYSQVAPSMVWMVDRFNNIPATSNCGTF